MEGSIRVSAKTVDDAITEALIQLGVTSDRLEYEVIEKGSAGFLGIGMKQAVIEARRKKDDAEETVDDFKKEIEKEFKKDFRKENKKEFRKDFKKENKQSQKAPEKEIVKEESEQERKIRHLMHIIREAAHLAGFEVVGRITFKDKKTGKEFK